MCCISEETNGGRKIPKNSTERMVLLSGRRWSFLFLHFSFFSFFLILFLLRLTFSLLFPTNPIPHHHISRKNRDYYIRADMFQYLVLIKREPSLYLAGRLILLQLVVVMAGKERRLGMLSGCFGLRGKGGLLCMG